MSTEARLMRLGLMHLIDKPEELKAEILRLAEEAEMQNEQGRIEMQRRREARSQSKQGQ